MEELTNTLSLEISEYSTTAGIENIPREIISEALCREKNNQSEFSKELIKLMRRKQ